MGSPASIFDSLYCSEEHWVDFDCPDDQHSGDAHCLGLWGWDKGNADDVGGGGFDQDLFWDDQELVSLSSKEESSAGLLQSVLSDRFLESARAEAVEWMMKVHSYYGFSAPTAVLAVNYLDRFLSKFQCEADDEDERSKQQKQQQQQPWVTQLTAVACLSLAAKVEESQVPLLLDLQVDETRDLFDAKTVRKMELLVLSTLQWRMNPVTPLSFLDHFARRLGLKGHLCRDLIRRSELVLLHVIPDPRFLRYLPSAMATAVMLHTVESFDPSMKAQYLDLLSGVILGIEKGIMDECRDLVSELAAQDRISSHCQHHSNKRKHGAATTQHIPRSPRGVADVCFSCPSSDSECSSDSWSVVPGGGEAAYPAEALPKRSRTLCSSVIKE